MTESSVKTTLVSTEKWSSLPSYSQLSPNQMECVTLSINGKNITEIANYLNMKPNTAKQHLSNAIRKIKTIDRIGEQLSNYSHMSSIGPILIAEGFFAVEQSK